jgi:uncharacterized membrane protein YeaQ/YmgE (transglycosylase-associated protein family)
MAGMERLEYSCLFGKVLFPGGPAQAGHQDFRPSYHAPLSPGFSGSERSWHEYGNNKGSFPEHFVLSDMGRMGDNGAAEAFHHLGVRMNILWMIVIGFVVGAIAKLLTPGRDPGGFIITVLLGIGGSFAATYIGQHFGWYREGQPAGFIGAILGAILILIVYRLIRRR